MPKARQSVDIRMGGKTRTLRFRMHEMSILEERLVKSGINLTIPEILETQKIGMVFVREAVAVGVAHEFVGKKGKEARFTIQTVGRWFDECGENGNAEYAEVVAAAVEAVILGLPGAAKAMDEEKERLALEEAESESDSEVGQQTENPLTSIEASPVIASTGTSLSSQDALSV